MDSVAISISAFLHLLIVVTVDEKRSCLGRSLQGYNVSLFDRTEAPEFLFFFSYRSRLGLWRIRSRGYWEKEHGERNGTNGTVTEWTSELRHFIILAVFLKKALARFTL